MGRDTLYNLVGRDGKPFTVVGDDALATAATNGARLEATEEGAARASAAGEAARYQGLGSAVVGGLEAGARGVTGGLSDLVIGGLGNEYDREDLRGRKAAHPTLNTGIELGAGVASALAGSGVLGKGAAATLGKTPVGLLSRQAARLAERKVAGTGTRAALTRGAQVVASGGLENAALSVGMHLGAVGRGEEQLDGEALITDAAKSGAIGGALVGATVGGASLIGRMRVKASSLFGRADAAAVERAGAEARKGVDRALTATEEAKRTALQQLEQIRLRDQNLAVQAQDRLLSRQAAADAAEARAQFGLGERRGVPSPVLAADTMPNDAAAVNAALARDAGVPEPIAADATLATPGEAAVIAAGARDEAQAMRGARTRPNQAPVIEPSAPTPIATDPTAPAAAAPSPFADLVGADTARVPFKPTPRGGATVVDVPAPAPADETARVAFKPKPRGGATTMVEASPAGRALEAAGPAPTVVGPESSLEAKLRDTAERLAKGEAYSDIVAEADRGPWKTRGLQQPAPTDVQPGAPTIARGSQRTARMTADSIHLPDPVGVTPLEREMAAINPEIRRLVEAVDEVHAAQAAVDELGGQLGYRGSKIRDQLRVPRGVDPTEGLSADAIQEVGDLARDAGNRLGKADQTARLAKGSKRAAFDLTDVDEAAPAAESALANASDTVAERGHAFAPAEVEHIVATSDGIAALQRLDSANHALVEVLGDAAPAEAAQMATARAWALEDQGRRVAKRMGQVATDAERTPGLAERVKLYAQEAGNYDTGAIVSDIEQRWAGVEGRPGSRRGLVSGVDGAPAFKPGSAARRATVVGDVPQGGVYDSPPMATDAAGPLHFPEDIARINRSRAAAGMEPLPPTAFRPGVLPAADGARHAEDVSVGIGKWSRAKDSAFLAMNPATAYRAMAYDDHAYHLNNLHWTRDVNAKAPGGIGKRALRFLGRKDTAVPRWSDFDPWARRTPQTLVDIGAPISMRAGSELAGGEASAGTRLSAAGEADQSSVAQKAAAESLREGMPAGAGWNKPAPKGLLSTLAAPGEAPAASGLLGKLADAGAVLEGVQALGMVTPLDPDKIPLVGPLLGMYLKFRGLRMAASKLGLHVPAGGSVTVRATANRVRQQMARTVDRVLAGGQRALRAGAVVATSQAWRVEDVLKKPLDGEAIERDKRRTMTLAEATRARAAEARALAANPAAVAAAVRGRLQDDVLPIDPDVVDATIAAEQRKNEYLAKHAPIEPPPTLFRQQTWEPAFGESVKFARRVRTVRDPSTIYQDILDGTLTSEGADAFREVYPHMYAETRDYLLEQATALDNTLPPEYIANLSALLRVPLRPSLRPENVTRLQEAGVDPHPAGVDGGAVNAPPAGAAPDLASAYQQTPYRGP